MNSLWRYVFAFLVCTSGIVCAQVIEPDAVAVPVRIDGIVDASIWTDPDDESITTDGWLEFNLDTSSNPSYYGSGSFAWPGWSVSPAKKYTISVAAWAINSVQLQFSVPAGYRCYIGGVLTTRWAWTPESAQDSTMIEVRFDRDQGLSFGQSTSMRPGRIYWAVGLGSLTSGRPAGILSMRAAGFTNLIYTPAVLDFGTNSAEVIELRDSTNTYIRQIIVPSGVVAISLKPGSSSEYYIRFYDIKSPCLVVPEGKVENLVEYGYTINDSTGTGWVYEYLVGNPNPAATPNGSLTITQTTRTDDSTRSCSTTMNRGTSWAGVYDWHDTANTDGAPATTAAYKSFYLGVNGNSYTAITSIGSFWQDTRTYSGSGWGGGVLLSQTLAGVTTSFGYTNYDLTTASTGGGSWVKYDYYSDWDRLGQVQREYKPFGDQPTVVTTGEVTTYNYVADWTGRVCLPSLIETRVGGVNGTVVKKSEFTYDYSSQNLKWQDRWSLTKNATESNPEYPQYQLVETIRKDYFGAGVNDYFKTTILTFHENVLPEGQSTGFHRYFEGMPYAEIGPDGSMVVNVYMRGSYNDSNQEFTACLKGTAMLRVTLKGTSVGDSSDPKTVAYPLFSYGTAQQNTHPSFWLIKGKTTGTGTIVGSDGLVRETLGYVCTTSGALVMVRRDRNYYNPGGFLARTERFDNENATSDSIKVVENVWQAGRLKSSKDTIGVNTEYYYYANGRIWKKVVSGKTIMIEGNQCTVPAATTFYTYNDAGYVLSEEHKDGAEPLTKTWAYDTGGRAISYSSPGADATTISYPTALQTQKVFPGGATRIETRFPDGRVKSICGTSVIAETYSYDVTSGGNMRVRKGVGPSNGGQAGHARYQEKTFDWVGRPVSAKRPGFSGQVDIQDSFSYYPANEASVGTLVVPKQKFGRLWSIQRTGMANIILDYDINQQSAICINRSGLDIDGIGGVDPASTDRVYEASESFENDGTGTVWIVKREWNYKTDGDNTPTLVSVVKDRLSPIWSSGEAALRSERRKYDVFGNETKTRMLVYASDSRRVTEIYHPGKVPQTSGSTPVEYVHELCGLVVVKKEKDGHVYVDGYDGLRRKNSHKDPRTGATTFTYHFGRVWIKSATDAAGKLLFERTYDAAGRVILSKDSFGYTTRTAYSPRGEVCGVWGTGKYPVAYGYNDYGERTTMYTYRDRYGYFERDSAWWPYSGEERSETNWLYDSASGLLVKKTDSAGRFVEYSYNQRGQLKQRFSARYLPGGAQNTTRMTTTYSYYGDSDLALPANVRTRNSGELYGISYNDNGVTPKVFYSYDRRGAVICTIDGAGTHTYTRCICGKIESETIGSKTTGILKDEIVTEYFQQQCIEYRALLKILNPCIAMV